jgi:NhaP-type Na+/H+ or K+/H+ antiporter
MLAMTSGDVLLIGGGLLAFAFISRRVAGTPLTAPIAFVVLGLAVGSEGLDLLGLELELSGVLTLVEAALALLLFSDAADLDARRLVRQRGLPLRLLAVGLPLTIVLGAVIAAWMLPGLAMFEAVALAVVLAPTDAALGQAVVSDQRLPPVVRQGLSVESGLNDGVCVPLLLAAIAFADVDASPGHAGTVLVDLVEELAIAGAVGCVAGLVVGSLRNWSTQRGWLLPGWAVLVPLITTGMVYIVTVDLGGSGFIASFVAGLTYGRTVGPVVDREKELDARLGELFGALTFVLFGAVMVGRGLSNVSVPTVLYALLSLTVIRLAPVAVALAGSRARPPTVALIGWFGPRGLATIVFALTIVEASGLPQAPLIIEVATVTVLLSVFAHGLTAPWLVARYATWFGVHRAELTFESGTRVDADEHGEVAPAPD